MTTCEMCRRAEMTSWQRVREDALTLLLGPSMDQRLHRATAPLLSLTGTWYDRHRRAFVESGDWQELCRMLRHVR